MADTLTFTLDTGDGEARDVVIKLRPDLAPGHVARITELASEGFYDGVIFHRVINGFMAQGGDPTGTGTGGSEHPDLPAEFSPPGKAKFMRGTCGMARTNNPNSANSQFFIMFAPAPSLDGQYTIWGKVAAGMDVVDKIKRGQGPNGMVREPDRIKSARVGAPAEAAAPAGDTAGGAAGGVDSTPAADA
jgi:peptidylprolyl isomerase